MENKLMDVICNDIKGIDNQIKEIRLVLENETYRRIKVIAEGTCASDKNLECQDPRKMLLIRVEHLEKELIELKRRAESLA